MLMPDPVKSSIIGQVVWRFVFAMAPVTALVLIFDTINTAGPSYPTILIGGMVAIIAGLLWPVTWSVWAFQFFAGNSTAISRAAEAIVGA
jgi:hypothetical protein